MFGLLPLPWWGYIIVILILTQITIQAVTLYLHRSQAHRSIEFHPIVSHFFRFWLWLTTGMVTKEFAAIHRKHHAKVETDEDPHSPVAKGIHKVLFEGAELYRDEAKNKETMVIYGEGTPDDWVERNVYTKWQSTGLIIMFIVNVLLFGVLGVTIWAIQMAWIPLFAAGVVNGIGHYWGYRNFESKDASRNITPFAIFLGGEELHNNHHAYASSAKFSAKWWEIDSGWYVIRFLQIFGLAKPKRILPKLKSLPSKNMVDKDTLTAVITSRLQVMAGYTREVIVPALKAEKRNAGKRSRELLHRARTLLTRDECLIPSAQKQQLEKMREHFKSLDMVYQFRLKLQNIWSRHTASQKELIEALQEWCRQAEASGVDALFHFSRRLKSYTLA